MIPITLESIFWTSALVGSVLFFIRCLMMLIGFSDLHETDGGGDLSFKVLSFHSMTGFLMMFGWVGLAALKEFNFSEGRSLLIALVSGALTLLSVKLLFAGAKKLISPGIRFNLKQTEGLEAIVYQRISKISSGKIHVTVDQISRELEAVSIEEEIPPFTKVRVVKALEGNRVLVIQNME